MQRGKPLASLSEVDLSTTSSHTDPFGTYYDPSPQQNLSRPLVVCGFFGCGASRIAKRVAAPGGWPHVDIYEQTAHKLGEHRALSGISIDNPEWSAIEDTQIETSLRNRPCAVIGLTDGYLPGPRLLDLLKRFAHVVNVQCAWLELQQNLLNEIEAEPERLPEFMEHDIPDLHTLQILHRQRKRLYQAAHITIDASTLAPAIAAQRIMAAIGKLT